MSLRSSVTDNPDHLKSVRKYLCSSVVHLGLAKFTNREQAPATLAANQPNHSATPFNQRTTPRSSNRGGGTPVSTLKLIEARNIRIEHKKEGQSVRARTLDKRIKEQGAAFATIAKEIHHSGKEEFLAGIAECASKNKSSSGSETNVWDGSLTTEDVFYLSKRTYDTKKQKSVYTINIDF